METIEEYMEREKRNLKVEISLYERGVIPRANSARQPMTEISGRMSCELAKIELSVIEANNILEAHMLLRNAHKRLGSPFTEFPKIRMLAVGGASGGRTLKVTELTKEELEKAREIANQKVDEWLNNFRKEVM